MSETPQIRVYTGIKAWDTIWRWTWFTGPPCPDEDAAMALHALLSPLNVKTVLDCACGLGQTTFALADLGHDVEGADASNVAIKLASALAVPRNQHIRFFHSSWARLGDAAQREYDCVYNDSFEWSPTRASMRASATGIHSVLKPGGRFVFSGSHQWLDGSRPDVDAELRSEGRFEALPVCERDGVRLTTVVSRERIPGGILGNRIHIVEENGTTRVEVASVPDIRKWIWQDYVDLLADVGFRRVYTHRGETKAGRSFHLNVAEK